MRTIITMIFMLMLAGSNGLAWASLVNGSFSQGETGWIRWWEPLPEHAYWSTSDGAATCSVLHGSCGWYQRVSVWPDWPFTVGGLWSGDGYANSCEVLLFNDDGRPIVQQCINPAPDSVISRVTYNAGYGMPFGSVNFCDYRSWVYSSGNSMYVVLKTTSYEGWSTVTFDNLYLDYPLGSEPSSVLALVGCLGGFVIYWRRHKSHR